MTRINLMGDTSKSKVKVILVSIGVGVGVVLLFWAVSVFHPMEDEIGANGYKSIRVLLDTDCPEMTPKIDAIVEQNKKITRFEYGRFYKECKAFKRDREKRILEEVLKNDG